MILLILFQTPDCSQDWKIVAEQFCKKWIFPNFVGAIDGKHFQIQPPPNSGSFYFIYKGSHSIVLMAVANANYEFLYVDVGSNGSVSDGGVWKNCTLSSLLENNDAKLYLKNAAPVIQIQNFLLCLLGTMRSP